MLFSADLTPEKLKQSLAYIFEIEVAKERESIEKSGKKKPEEVEAELNIYRANHQ